MAKDAAAKTWTGLIAVNGRRYSANAAGAPTAPTLGTPVVDSSSAITIQLSGQICDSLTPEYRVTGGGSWTTNSAISVGSSSYQFTGLSASTAYDFRFVVGANGQTANSSTANSTTSSGGAALFSDNFASGDLSHTENGVSWGSSIRASVIGGVLNMPWPGGTIETEQRFSFGATQYLELWIKYDIFVSLSYDHQSGNNKGHIMLWSNSTGSKPNDGYGANDEMLFSLELNPHSNGDGGSFGAPRYQSLNASGGVIVDVNASSEAICPNLITVSDLGQWRTIVQHVKAATALGGSGPPTVWADTSDGAYEVWKDGVNILRRTTLNLFQEPGWAGFNRGYLFGARNGSNPVDDYINIDNFVIATTNIFGVT
jgi:hypothetical protein